MKTCFKLCALLVRYYKILHVLLEHMFHIWSKCRYLYLYLRFRLVLVEFRWILRRLSKIILSSHHYLFLYEMLPINFAYHGRKQERAGALHQPSAVVVALAVVDIRGLLKLRRFTRQRQCSLMEVGLITTGNHSVKLQILCSLLISRFLLNRCI